MTNQKLKPQISILMPVFNAELYIKKTVESILAQDFKNFEIIIIDDASKDNSLKLIKKIVPSDERLKLFINKKNKGRASAINIGFKHAKGRYITFSDADDLFYPERLKKQINFLEQNPNIDMIYGDMIKLFENGEKVLKKAVDFNNLNEPLDKLKKEAKEGRKFEDAYKILNKKNYIPGTSVMFRRKIIDNGIKMDEELIYEDCDFNFQVIGAGYKIKRQPIITFKYRIHKEQKTNRINILFATKQILNKLKKGDYFDEDA